MFTGPGKISPSSSHGQQGVDDSPWVDGYLGRHRGKARVSLVSIEGLGVKRERNGEKLVYFQFELGPLSLW